MKARILIETTSRMCSKLFVFFSKARVTRPNQLLPPAGIMTAVESSDFDLLLMDLNYTRDTTSGQEGLDLLARLRAADNTLPVVVMTAWGSVELAVEAMCRGARDFVQKTVENARLLSVVHTQIELSHAIRRSQNLEAETGCRCRWTLDDDRRVSRDAAGASIISRVGPSDANVLITESWVSVKKWWREHSTRYRGALPGPWSPRNAGGLC